MKRHVLLPGLVIFCLVAGAAGSSAAQLSTGDRSVFVPIVPCRLFDTRAEAPVGPRVAPLGPNEMMTQAVHGTNGNCNIPTDAVAVALNVTTLNSTSASYLTLWPSDAARPLASNLNWIAGAPPTPNKVDVKLSTTGSVDVFNLAGSVDVLADAVGYYVGHDHDDRYYTKGASDERYYAKAASDDRYAAKAALAASLATKVDKPVGQGRLLIGAILFQPAGGAGPSNAYYSRNGYVQGASAAEACAAAPVALPTGASVNQIDAQVYDNNPAAGLIVFFFRDAPGGQVPISLGVASTGIGSTPGEITASQPITPAVIASDTTHTVVVCGLTTSTVVYEVSLVYDNPA